jgi:hypothetical protein
MFVSLSGCGGTVTPVVDAGDDVTPVDSIEDTTPVDPIALNEIDCQGRDWVEIVNRSGSEYDISGWFLTDSLTDQDHMYQIPAGTVIAAKGYVTIKAFKDPDPGFTFGIKCSSDIIYLMDADSAVIDQAEPGVVSDGHTWGRFPDMTGDWQVTLSTQGTANILTVDTPPELFDPLTVTRFEITLPEASVTALNGNPYEFVAGTLSAFVGTAIVTGQAVGVRLKSGLSFQPLSGKASFKIRADGYTTEGRIFGLKNITLNSMVDDRTMLHETLAYRLLRASGIPAPRTGYAWVTVNGQDYGLYVVVEAYDAQFAATNFNNTSHLYEGVSDLYVSEIDSFDIEDGSKTDLTDLTTLIDKVNKPADENWKIDVSGVADLAEMTRLWAVEHYIGHADGYSLARNNYFLHSTNDGVFTMLPWGTDRAFVDKPVFNECTGVICSKCMSVASCKSQYTMALTGIPAVVTQLDLVGFATQVAAAIATYAADDSDRKPYTVVEHTAAIEGLKTFINTRAADLP